MSQMVTPYEFDHLVSGLSPLEVRCRPELQQSDLSWLDRDGWLRGLGWSGRADRETQCGRCPPDWHRGDGDCGPPPGGQRQGEISPSPSLSLSQYPLFR